MVPRVLLLTQWFDPEPTFKGIVFAKELVQQGFDVEVVTGFPNYPGGNLYPGYRIKLFQKEIIDGVKVTRVPLYPSHGQSGIGRILNYVSFAAAASIYGVFFGRKPDVIYAYHPPLTVGLAAILIKLFRRAPVVYDIQDMWPDTLRATGMFSNERALSVVGRVCSWVYRLVDKIVVLSPGFQKLLADRGVPESKIDIVYNWCAEGALERPSGSLHADFPQDSSFKLLFAGNMGKAQALESVLEAAEILQTEAKDFRLIFLGSGVEAEALNRNASERHLSNVSFLPPVPMGEVGLYLAASSALLVHLKKDPLFEITVPSKTQAYMAAGKPVLMAVNGDAAELVREAGCGQVAESESARSIADAAHFLMRLNDDQRFEMGQRGRQYYKQKLAMDVGVKKFASIFINLVKR